MTKEEFTYLLSHPEHIDGTKASAIGHMVAEYPYFQAARALYLKALKSQESFKYNLELKVTAAHTSDRSILFDFITSERFNQNDISELIKKNTALLKEIEVKDVDDISVNKSVMIDDALKRHMKDSERVFDPGLFVVKPADTLPPNQKSSPSIEIEEEKIEPTPEKQLKIGQPLEFDKNESHSFTEWLKITKFQPIQRSNETTLEDKSPSTARPAISSSKPRTESALEKKLDIIDRFISSNPKIAPVREASPSVNLAQTKLVQNDSLMTETLARIYLEQKKYDKAIQSYRILMLKYPEKSSFFADQIKAVKQLQENNT